MSIPTKFNLADLYEAQADAFGDRLAIVSGDLRMTYGELDHRATKLANYFASQGLGEGDHIGLYLYNGHEYLECMLAAWKIRARTINVNYRYVADELRYIFENAELKALVYEPDLAEFVHPTKTDAMTLMLERGEAYEAALASGSDSRDFPARSDDDLCIIYTGGTTGMPRGVMWRHEDFYYAGLQGGNPGGESFETPEQAVKQLTINGDGLHIHCPAPMIHGSGQLAAWIALFNGGVAIIVPGRSYRPDETLRLCAAEHVHSINIVGDAMALPLITELEANPGKYQLTDLNVISSAGAVLSGNVREKLEELIPSAMVMNNFGASETGHQGTAFYEDGKAIWIFDTTHSIVVDDDLNPVEPGSDVVGKLARFGHIPLGYYKDEEKTAKTFFEKDGVRYVVPGDMAMVAEDETVIFLGRGSVCINSGGEKVYAEEVEEALKHHPEVFDAVVVGVPDERWGQRVEALVTARVDAPNIDDIEAFCRTKVAGYKTPRKIWVVDDLNRQPSGKPDYRWARERAIELGASA
ncbi:MAG: acyl-CoA synthetase [Deltaproteobacteria bacterium]|nr:MAG: acyl-CoA synthetase [Deltaproteobacteria bacterium]